MSSTARIASIAIALTVLAACLDDPPVGTRSLAAGNGIKSQLRGYDLGPPFPAGFRDSGLINGYDEAEWVPFVAAVEGRKLEVAESREAGDGTYRVQIILPTYSPRHGANGISELEVTGTYGQGYLTPIPDPFDDRWLVDNGYSPFVLGAFADDGSADTAPEILGASQRSGPTRFGGDVASASVSVRFTAPPGTDRVELRFAVRLAPPGLEPIGPTGQGFPGLAAGDALGAADFFPGPGPIFVGYHVGEPTGIATVPIRVERHSCESDDDCVPGEVCAGGGDCTDPCVTDAECPTGELCEDGLCEPPPPPCVDDEECPGEFCVGGYCVPECPDDCADPELCDPDPCYPPDGDPPPCITDDQCPAREVCEDGVCQPPDPPCDLSCPEDDVCVDDYCVPPDTPCDDDFDCPGGEVCVGDVCEPGDPPCTGPDCAPCTDDPDCPGGYGCIGGVCVPLDPPVPCTDDTECSDGRTCEAGFCEPPPEPCGPTGECRPGELCEEGPNECVPEHPPVPCSSPTECPSGDLCVDGFCTPPDDGGPGTPCKNMHDCDPGLSCEGKVCTPPDPPTCADDGDCPAGDYCVGGVCVPPHPPIPCVDAAECPSGDECISGWCEPPGGCTRDEHCPGGELCEDGTCRPGDPPEPCTVDEDCPPTEDDVWVPVCYGGFCTPSGGDCVDDADCPGGMVCEEGVCIDADPPAGCETQYDCGGGHVCEGGFCVPTDSPDECTTADDCPRNPDDDVGPACVGGVCTTSRVLGPPCADVGDCAAGTTCTAGVCAPVSGACDLDGDCGAGACIDGWCGVACTETAQCATGEVCSLGRCAGSCDTYLQCGVFEACYGTGCVPVHAILAHGLGGSQEIWNVDVPGAGDNEDVGGGCRVAAGGGWSALALVGLALAMVVCGGRRRALLLVGALAAVALVACGDGGGADDDDGVDAGAPDAAPLPDAGPNDGDGGGPGSPYTLVSCAGDPADAAPVDDAGAADAGPASDAGAEEPPEGIDDSCCDPDGLCPGTLACIEGPTDELHRCRPRCDLDDGECPHGGVCANFGGQGVCIPASTEGMDCAPELCDAATICVGSSADDAVCRRRCDTSDDCADGQTCTELLETDAKACLE